MSREEEKGGCPLQTSCLPCTMCGCSNKHSHLLYHPTLHTAEHFLAFLMNYQDPQTLKNKYIDQLVRSSREAAGCRHSGPSSGQQRFVAPGN